VLHWASNLQYRLGMSDYDVEAVDRLPFTTPEKSARYRTEDYHPTWLNLVFKSTADFGEDVAEVVG
jgi:hypothetical protein